MASHYQHLSGHQYNHNTAQGPGGSPSPPPLPRFGPNYPSLRQQQQRSAVPIIDFTPAMRDLQARGRDPETGKSNSHTSTGDWPKTAPPGHPSRVREANQHLILERSRLARDILDQPELLMMMAQKEEDSIPATRLRYMRIMCCLPEAPDAEMNSHVRNQGISSGNKRHRQQPYQQPRQSQ